MFAYQIFFIVFMLTLQPFLTDLTILAAEEVFIPAPFRNGQLIEQVILISDVDGVIRDSTDGVADERIIRKIKSLLTNNKIDATFISGTPIDNDLTLEPWRRGNVPLNKVFGSAFTQEVFEKNVTIYGVLGGHCMKEDGSLQVVDEYTPEVTWELAKLFGIRRFLSNG